MIFFPVEYALIKPLVDLNSRAIAMMNNERGESRKAAGYSGGF